MVDLTAVNRALFDAQVEPQGQFLVQKIFMVLIIIGLNNIVAVLKFAPLLELTFYHLRRFSKRCLQGDSVQELRIINFKNRLQKSLDFYPFE